MRSQGWRCKHLQLVSQVVLEESIAVGAGVAVEVDATTEVGVTVVAGATVGLGVTVVVGGLGKGMITNLINR